MAQSTITVTGMKDTADSDRLIDRIVSVAGIRFVKPNHEDGYVVVTHDNSFDEAEFKQAVEAAGFGT